MLEFEVIRRVHKEVLVNVYTTGPFESRTVATSCGMELAESHLLDPDGMAKALKAEGFKNVQVIL